MPLTDGPTCPPLAREEATIVRKKALQSAGAHSSSVFFFFFPPGSLSPACPSSPLLFTHRQLSQFPNAVIPSNILCSCFLLFSCSLAFLPLSLLLAGLFLGWGGRGWGRNREREKKQVGGGVTFAALWLTTCVSGSLYLHVSHGKEGGGRGWRERKDEHMVLVCWVKFRAGLFVSCDERREIRSRNHLQIWLLPRAVVRLFLETGNVHKCTHKTLFSCTEIYMKTVFSRCMQTHCSFGPLKDTHSDWLKVLWSEHFYFLRNKSSNSPSLADCFPLWCTLPCCSFTLYALGTSTAGTGLAIIKPSWEPEPGTLLPHLPLLSLRCASLYPHESVVVQLPCRGGRGGGIPFSFAHLWLVIFTYTVGSIIDRDAHNFHRLWEVQVLCEFTGPVGLVLYWGDSTRWYSYTVKHHQSLIPGVHVFVMQQQFEGYLVCFLKLCTSSAND